MIRALTKNDAKNLFVLDNELFLFDKYSLNQIYEELSCDNRIYLGFFENENLIGFVGASYIFDESDLIKIGVSKNFQNKGIATKLFFELKKELKQKNVSKINLEVREKNEKAISFYTSLGFKEIAVRKKYYTNDNAKILVLEI